MAGAAFPIELEHFRLEEADLSNNGDIFVSHI